MNTKMKVYNHLLNEIDVTYHEIALKLGLSDSAMLILYTVCYNGDKCLLSDITHSAGISKQTVNSAIRKLEGADIVYLELVGHRKKLVRLTDKGKKYVKNTVLKVIEIENNIINSWHEGEWTKFLELNQKFVTALKNEVKELKGETE